MPYQLSYPSSFFVATVQKAAGIGVGATGRPGSQGVPRAIFPQNRCRGQFSPQKFPLANARDKIGFPLRKLYFYAENIFRTAKSPKRKFVVNLNIIKYFEISY